MAVADNAITQTIDLTACYERMLLIRRFEQLPDGADATVPA